MKFLSYYSPYSDCSNTLGVVAHSISNGIIIEKMRYSASIPKSAKTSHEFTMIVIVCESDVRLTTNNAEIEIKSAAVPVISAWNKFTTAHCFHCKPRT